MTNTTKAERIKALMDEDMEVRRESNALRAVAFGRRSGPSNIERERLAAHTARITAIRAELKAIESEVE